MTRDEHRKACIGAMARACYESKRHINMQSQTPTWEELGPVSRKYRINRMTAAFDALHGIARVCGLEVTDEMDAAGARSLEQLGAETLIAGIFRAMSAAGDLTNPPETKL